MDHLVVKGLERQSHEILYEKVNGYWPDGTDETISKMTVNKSMQNEMGHPVQGALIWAYMETFIEGVEKPLEGCNLMGDPVVNIF